jgi:hypothetical protein
MECVMVNLLEAGTKILVANNGIWGIRSQDMARRYCTRKANNSPHCSLGGFHESRRRNRFLEKIRYIYTKIIIVRTRDRLPFLL